MPARAPELPPAAVLVHIGPHKTGTSSIQSVADVSRDLMRNHGVSYPGSGRAHHVAARSLRQLAGGWERDAEPPPDPQRWTRLAETVSAEPGRVLISSEFFAQADDAQRRKLVADLGADRVHIVMAARNPGDIAVSTWQQVLRQGYPTTLENWLEKNFRRTERTERPDGFWSFADSVALVERWAEVVSIDRITVIALDERDRRLLATTFEQLLGLRRNLLANVTPPDPNRGLSAAEAELLLQVIRTLRSQLSWAEYNRVIRHGMLMRLLRSRAPRPGEAKSQLPQWAAEQAAVEGERAVEGLTRTGVRVVGNPDALRVARASSAPADPIGAIDQVPLDVAAEAVAGTAAAAMGLKWDLSPRSASDGRSSTQAGRDVDTIPARELAEIAGRRAAASVARRVRRRLRRS